MADAITITDLENAKLDVDHIADIATSQLDTATDRLGTTKLTIAGVNSHLESAIADIDNVISTLGYETPVLYAGGILIERATQTIERSGIVYGPLSASIPFTTTGVWATDQVDFRVIQGIAPNGHFGTINNLKLDATLSIGDFVEVERYLSGVNSGILVGTISAAGGVYDDGSKILLTTSGLQFNQIFNSNVDVMRYGAIGDGFTDETLIIDNIESTFTGQHIDLRGLTIITSSLPTGNNYYNGCFKVGSDIFKQGILPRNHPLESPTTSVKFLSKSNNVYKGLNVAQFPISNGDTVYVWREAPGHGNENTGTTIKSAISEDYGQTFKRPTGPGNAGPEFTFVYTDTNSDTRNFAHGTMSARLGIVSARVEPAGTHLDPVFLYSDDEGVSWSSSMLTGFTAGTWNFHSKIYPWPASAGGHDTLGYTCYFYKSDGSGIGLLRTIDNGATWVESVDVVTPGAGFAVVTEMSVSRVSDSDEWVMGIRTGSSDNMAISTSTDLISWSAITDSSLFLGANPPELFYSDGKIWNITTSREGKAILPEYDNAILISGVNAKGLFSGSESFNGWYVISALPFWPTGYISMSNSRGRWSGVFTIENYAGSTQSTDGSLAIISSDIFSDDAKKEPQKNLVINGSLRQWPLGTTITGTTRDTVVPGITFSRQSSSPGWTITRITGDESQYAMRIRRDDSDILTSEMSLTINLPFDSSVNLRDKQIAVSFRARVGSGFSSASAFLKVQARQTNHGSEQEITGASGLFPIGDGPIGTTSSGVTPSTLWQKFVMVPGRVNTDTNQICVRIGWVPSGTAANDYLDIEQIKIECAAQATEFQYDDLSTEKSKADRFAQVFSVITPPNTTQYYLYPGGQMHVIPNISLDSGSVFGTPTRDGFRLDNVTGSPLTSVVTARCIF